KFALKSRNPAAEFLSIDNADIKLDLNSAGLAEILRTKALPPKLAESVIAYRRDHGPFSALEEVKDVKGIGKFRYEKIKQFFFVE
ncbi:MAG: helix-hairpin-helix domain-containing protein, partial [Candidatus Omnitrophota bacterium]|nr:helix-hairpin-helix domain-containing protein [Candidatus Omnitrophota bacterium]